MIKTYPAKLINQEQLNSDFWLVTLDISLENKAEFSWQIGTSFIAENNFGTLLYPNKNPTLLSSQAWQEITQVTLQEPQEKIDITQPTKQLWLGENLGQAVVFDAAKRWKENHPYLDKDTKQNLEFQALLATNNSFIFTPKPAKFILPLLPEAIGSSQLLEDYKIPNRLASQEFIAGCYNGDLIDLYKSWLEMILENPQENSENWQVFAAVSQETYKQIQQTTPTYIQLIRVNHGSTQIITDFI